MDVVSQGIGAGGARALVSVLVLAAFLAPSVARADDPAPPAPTDTLLTNGSWTNPAIWSHGVPTASDDVDLNGAHATVDGPVSVHSLNMDSGALFGSTAVATLTIGVGGNVTGGLWAPDAGGAGAYISDLELPTTVAGPAYIHSLSILPASVNAIPSSTDTASLDLFGASAIEPPTIQFANGFTVAGATLTNHGSLNVGEGVLGGGAIVNAAGATMTLSGGPNSNTPVTFSNAVDNYGTLAITGTIELRNTPPPADAVVTGHSGAVDVAAGAEVQVNGNNNPSSNPAIVLQGGKLTGAGKIDGGVENDGGTVSPGGDGHIGILTIGDPNWADQNFGLVQKAGGVVRVDVRGTQPGTTLDQLQVGGPVTLGGSLYIDATGYAPAAGVDHEIVRSIGATASSPSGTFAQLSGPGAGTFQTLYGPSSAPDSVILRSTSGGGGGGGAGGGQPPAVASVTQSHKTWRLGTKLAVFSRAGAPVGDTFAFSLNEPARVTLRFDRTVPGRELRGRCVAPTNKNRRRPACKRTLTAGAISFSAHTGVNKVFFQGRLSKSRKLTLGRYTLTIIAVDAGKSSRARTLSFTIVK
jgi:hypothetical protein